MKISSGLAVVLCAISLAFAPAASAEKVASLPAPRGYVDDYAGVLSESARTELEALCRDLHDQTKAQVFFVTVKTTEGQPVERFSNELFAKWKIGEKKTDRGVLLLLATADHKRWIEVGYGFEGILNDAKAGDIGREMVPALKASNYDDAARIGVRDVSRIIAEDSHVSLAGLDPDGAPAEAAPPVPVTVGRSSAGPIWAMVLIPCLFLGFFGLIAWGTWRNRGRRMIGSSGFTPMDSDSSSTFGSDSSSSDDSFSGGDGGSSGGGGAGGDW